MSDKSKYDVSPKIVFERLVEMARLDSLLSSRLNKRPGGLLERLTACERASLRNLKSEDVAAYRFDWY